MQADRASRDVVELVLAIARKLNARVVAQGIEKSAQLDHLRTLGCHFAQGYLFAPPLDPESAHRFLRDPARSPRAATA
jgi:EAL domain-containing protein (putative c-di-GMP-specific phosphodiesterase class I)